MIALELNTTEDLLFSELIEIQGGTGGSGVQKPNEFALGMGMIVIGIGTFAVGGGTLIVAGVYTAIDAI